MSKPNYQKMTDGQKLANWMAELGTCVYNRLKKGNKLVYIEKVFSHGHQIDDVPKYFQVADRTINDVEKHIQNTQFYKDNDYDFHFSFSKEEDGVEEIFAGNILLVINFDYLGEKNDFISTLYLGSPQSLGMKPQATKKEKSAIKISASSKSSEEDTTHYEIDKFIESIKPRSAYEKMTQIELKTELYKLDLSMSGSKDKLIDRLLRFENSFEPLFSNQKYSHQLLIEQSKNGYRIYRDDALDENSDSVKSKKELKNYMIKWYNDHQEKIVEPKKDFTMKLKKSLTKKDYKVGMIIGQYDKDGNRTAYRVTGLEPNKVVTEYAILPSGKREIHRFAYSHPGLFIIDDWEDDEPGLTLVRWDTALHENVGLTFAKPIFDDKTENEIDNIVQEKWEHDEDFQEDYRGSTLYFDSGHSVFITDEGKTKWRITKDYERKKKNWPNFEQVVEIWEKASDDDKLNDKYLNLDTLKITTKSKHFVDEEFRVYSIDKDMLDEIVMVLG